MSYTAVSLGFLPGSAPPNSQATGCSGNGIVVGWSVDSGGAQTPVYWDAGNVIHALPIPSPGIYAVFAQASACSTDGSIIVGLSGEEPFTAQLAIKWTGGPSWVATTLPSPPLLGAPVAVAYGCSGDGSIISGYAVNDVVTGHGVPCVWVDEVLAFLPLPGADVQGNALAVSEDGSTVSGYTSDEGFTQQAVVWTGGPSWVVTVLGTLPSGLTGNPQVNAISSNGAIPVGVAIDSGGSQNAVFWNPTTANLLAGPLGGPNSSALGCDATGSKICGADVNGIATLWTSGVGANLPTFSGAMSVNAATGMSQDAVTIVGWGFDADSNETAVKWSGPVLTSSISIGDMLFRPSADFFDLSNLTNRRKLINESGCSMNLGPDGGRPFFNVAPAVFFTIPIGGANPNAFATNFGSGGNFTLSGGNLTFSSTAPCCSTETVPVPVGGPTTDDPQIMLSVSDDGGRTWSVLQKWRSMGKIGQYLKRLRWLKMGQFRQRIVKLEVTDPVRRNIVGFYEDIKEGME